MPSKFSELLARYVGSATARQLALGDVLGDRSWAVDISKGTATFDDLTFPIQLLGTEAEGDNSWLWAWANEASSLPQSILKSANHLRAMGHDQGPEFLVNRGFSLDGMSGHQVAIVCTGLLGTGPYYRGPYDGRALYFTVENATLPDVDDPRTSTVLTQVISSFPVDHRIASRSFLLDLAQQAVEGGGRTSSLSAPPFLSPVVMYHGLGLRSLWRPHLDADTLARRLSSPRLTMPITKNARCPQCGGGDLAVSQAGGTYDSRCATCGFHEGGTVSYPLPDEEFAQASLLVRCSSPSPTAHELNALRSIFPELAEESLQRLRARLAAFPMVTVGPFGIRLALALKAEAEAAGFVVHIDLSENPS